MCETEIIIDGEIVPIIFKPVRYPIFIEGQL
jgi:hypothetical protein